jgi:hypothetical protein
VWLIEQVGDRCSRSIWKWRPEWTNGRLTCFSLHQFHCKTATGRQGSKGDHDDVQNDRDGREDDDDHAVGPEERKVKVWA